MIDHEELHQDAENIENENTLSELIFMDETE